MTTWLLFIFLSWGHMDLFPADQIKLGAKNQASVCFLLGTPD